MINDMDVRMKKTVEKTKELLATIRTGRANPDILSKLQVDYYGTKVSLQQVASVSVPESRVLMLNIFDKGAVQSVEKAITSSGINLTPLTDGTVIRLRIPELTEERRKDLVKQVKKQCEDGKVSIRNIRRDYMDTLKSQEKNKDISEDEVKILQNDAQKITDKCIEEIDKISQEKEVEIMKV